MSEVAVCFLTYRRTEYALPCLESLVRNLACTGGWHLHIADNGSSVEHVNALVDMARSFGVEPSVSIAQGGGYGHNYNVATQMLHSTYDVIMPLEDDWRLLTLTNIDQYIAAAKERNACVRVGSLGIVGRLFGELVHYGGHFYLEFDPNSPDQYVFSGNPRIETRDWERAVGPWPEGLRAGETEITVAARKAARTRVLWPLGIESFGLFAHIGAVKA